MLYISGTHATRSPQHSGAGRTNRLSAGAVLLLALLGVAGSRPDVLRMLAGRYTFPPGPPDGLDRKPLRFRADPGPPDLVRFAGDIRSQTPRGARIALLLRQPDNGFSYAYWRASFLLSGRFVLLPLEPPDLPQADYVAVQGVPFGHPEFEHVWSGRLGESLWRRR